MLAKFDFVVTSVERLSNEWKRGHKISTNNYDFPSPLLKINFLRVVVDEVSSARRTSALLKKS